jgi:hypothetical protein
MLHAVGLLLQLQLAAADSAAYCCRLAEIQSAVGLATIGLMLASRLIFKVRSGAPHQLPCSTALGSEL